MECIFMLKHKFNAIRCELDGIKFASKKEAKRYKELKLLQTAGEILFFLQQVPLRLPGGIKYVLDFMVFWADGNITMEDVKGLKTPIYILKKKQVESVYPFIITEI
jgi:dsDNA-binding SOS-regulon protein